MPGHHSNHSLRATSASRLYEAGVDEQLIQERTGHRSNAVRGYKRTSSKLQQQVTQTLYGPTAKLQKSCTVSSDGQSSDFPVSESPEPAVQVHSDGPSPQGQLLRDTEEGKALQEGLAKANLSLSEAMCTRVCDLPPGLLGTIRAFMTKFARKQSNVSSSSDGFNFNLHVHFH